MGLASGALLLAGCGEPAQREAAWEVMGTTAEAVVYTRAEHDASRALEQIRSMIATAETDLDPWSEQGELGRLNRRASDEFYAIQKPDIYACLALAIDYAKDSEGAYDPTTGVLQRLYGARLGTGNPPRPTEIDVALSRVGWEKVTLEPEAHAVQFRTPGLQVDLGAVAHGCALDWAARTYARPGSIGGLLRLDGIYYAWESPPGADDWPVSIPDPREPGRELLQLRVSNRSVAVVGQPRPTTERDLGPPLLDPRTGRPVATDLLAVVVTADSAANAAALGQALYISGSLQGPKFFDKTRRTEAVLLVRADGSKPYLVASASIEKRITLSPELEAETDGQIRYLLPPASL